MKTPLEILKSYYGYNSFRPMQAEIITNALLQNDSLVLMPTGGGKSICFQIPALLQNGITVVVSPLISLMKDQIDALHANGIQAEALNSGNSVSKDVLIREKCLNNEIKLLYISPERLITEIDWMQNFLKISLFAIDEAHCISQWGHDFRPEYTQLGILHEYFPHVPIMALTATADKITKQDIIERLHLNHPQIYVSSFNRPNLSLEVKRGCSEKEKIKVLLDVIRRHNNESGIIYCMTRKTAEKVAHNLYEYGVVVGVYHAGMSIKERNQIQDDFLNDRIHVVVATIAFGMGIDKSNVRYVIHYNLPKSIENFYQEIGRGGRDGLPTETLLFFNLQDLITLRKFAEESGQKEVNLEKLKRMQEYAEAHICRRRILLNYFGEISDCACNNCDVCKSPPEFFDGTIIVQKALSAILRTNETVGFTMAIDILRGVLMANLMSKNFHQLKTFGAGRDIPFREWKDYFLQMLHMGFIEIAYDEERHLKVTQLGKNVLYNRLQVDLVRIIPEEKSENKKKRSHKSIIQDNNESGNKSDILFERLRNLRQNLAEKNHWPAYIVMSDKSLHALVAEQPITLEEFGEIFGIGKFKREAYGESFVSLIKEFQDKYGITKPKTKMEKTTQMSYMDRQKQLHEHAYAPWTKKDDDYLVELYKEGKSIKELMEIFGRNSGAIRSRLRKLQCF